MKIVASGNLRFFSGLVVMRRDRPGNVDISNEHWVGWYENADRAKGDWVIKTMDKPEHKGAWVSYSSAYDITDQAVQGMTVEGGA